MGWIIVEIGLIDKTLMMIWDIFMKKRHFALMAVRKF